ncbi:MAG: hypothetical protein A3F91_04675 [Flavobacteria bacterium RIFCSPLOWO2_12_FULL_35_11]|nr:MAG: hypothetical protein A3F91_04675 [Flavobacteria bacterium RIFCSPLOWO2_12_FULL_35_11]
MKKEKFLLPKKAALIVLIVLSFTYNSAFSQCTNPTPTGVASQVFCKTDNSTIANLVASGGTIVWYDAPSGGELYGTTEVLVNGITYFADNISGDSCSTSRLAVTVTIYGDFPTNVDVSVGKCAIDNPTVGSLSAIGENIAWYDAQFDGNLLPLSQLLENGKTYWVQQTENGCTSDRFPTTVSLIEPLTPTTAPIQSFCSPPNATVANLKATGTTILWYVSETSTTPLKSTALLIDGEDYWVAEIAFPCVSSNRAKTTVVIDAAPDAGESSALQECEVNFVTTNLFDLLGGTPDTTGIWTGPSTLSNGYLGTFEPGINTIGTYTYTVSSILGICPPDSATISIIITIVPPPTTANAVQVFCEIENATIADLSANGNNIVWYDTETSTIALSPSEALVTGEDYWGALPDPTSGCLSAIRLKITTNITVIPPPTTAEVNQIFCEIENATVADLSATGSGILWYDTETSTTPLSTSEGLIEGEDYWASQTEPTSACESATRLVVTVSILIPPPPTTSDVYQIFCEIDNPKVQNLNASGAGILWYATETSTTPLNPTDLLVNGASYWATQTQPASACESANRLVVTVSIIAPTPPTTTQANQTFCEIDNPTVANLNATGTGILWYASETSTTSLNPTDLLVNGASYWATQTDATSNCESKNRLVVNVSIIAPPPPTTNEQNQIFCAINNPTIANLSASGAGILWYASETSTIQLNPTDLLVDGATYWASQTAASGCESASRLVVNVTVITPQPPITITQSKTFCEIEKATIANLNDPGNVLLWYAIETSTTPLNATDLLVDGSVYWATQTIAAAGCEIANRLKVTVNITKILPPTTTQANQIFCEIENAKIGDLSASASGILWYDTETSTSPLNDSDLLVNGASYWATQTEPTSGCESASRLVVTVVINTTPPPTTALANQSFCIKDYLPNIPTIANLSASGSGILWYATATSTTPLNNTAALLDGTAYYATQTNVTSGCESASRLVVNVSIINPETPTTTSVNQAFCAADKPTVASLQASGTSIIWYASETAATPLNNADLLINGEDYWAANANVATGCESIVRLKVTVSITDVAPATIVNISQTFCESDSPTIANLAATGNGILWYATQTSTTPIPVSTQLINGSAYWAAQSNTTTGCVSSIRVVANVTLTAITTPTLISLGNEFCKIDNPTIADLNLNVSANNGGAITWYNAFPNGNLLNASAALGEGETYYAIETDVNGCKSINPLEVTVTLEACDEYDVEIYDGFSPTGNGTNDTFKIKNLRELYPDFKVEFFNRWGNLIYTANAANGDWNGRLNGDGDLSPAGVYFFIVYFNKENRKPIQRRLYLSR